MRALLFNDRKLGFRREDGAATATGAGTASPILMNGESPGTGDTARAAVKLDAAEYAYGCIIGGDGGGWGHADADRIELVREPGSVTVSSGRGGRTGALRISSESTWAGSGVVKRL